MATATAQKWYAWSNIKSGTVVIKCGELVDAKMLNIDEDEFTALIRAGSVRGSEYPPIDTKNPNSPSPIDYYRQKAKEAELNIGLDLSSSITTTPGIEEEDEN